MEITEVRIKLMEDPNDRLQGFCSITFDGCFVIRDLKIIQGSKGSFVAMPSRKLTDRCPECGSKNHLRARCCNECGAELDEDRAVKDDDGRAKLYADIAHPINSGCRDMIQARVLDAFEKEKVLAKRPGYVCTYDDYGEDRVARLKTPSTATTTAAGRTIRIDGPEEPPAPSRTSESEPARSHHLDSRSTTGTGIGSKVDDDFGAGVL